MTINSSGFRMKEEVKKIGILRANALGDFIVTLPALEAIRHSYPNSEIVLLGNEWHKKFLEEEESGYKRSPIDRVIVVPVLKGIREEKGKTEDREELSRFFSITSHENFDILLNFQGKGIAGIPFLKKIGARVIAGLGSEESENLDHILHYYYYQPETIRFLEAVALVGAVPVSLESSIRIFDKDSNEVNKVLEEYGVSEFAVFHPSGTDSRRMWSPENFSRLADEVAAKNVPVIFTGTQSDKLYLEQVFSKMKTKVFDFSEKLSLGGLAALFQKSQFVVAIDTGPLHLARAAGANTVGLYWGPNLINWGPLTRGKHRPVLNWNLHCPHCGIKPLDPFPFEPTDAGCAHSYFFLDGITVSQVMKEIDYLIRHIISF